MFAIVPPGASGVASCPVTVQNEGSTTVSPIPENAEGAFESLWAGTDLQVISNGSGFGISSIRNGTSDVGNTSRPLRLSEVNDTSGNHVYVFDVARDALVFGVRNNATMSFLTQISRAQVERIYEGTTTHWDQDGLGGPHIPIVSRARITASGSQPDMLRLTLTDTALEAATIAATGLPRLTESSDMADAVAANDYQIAYTSLANLGNPGMRAVPLSNGGPVVAPSIATVQNNTYPLRRELQMLLRNTASTTRIDNSDYVHGDDLVNYILSAPGQAGVGATGFVQVAIPGTQPVPDWDINMDGATSLGDLGAITAKWGQSTACPGWIRADGNNSGSVSLGDIGTVTSKWGNPGFNPPPPFPGPYSP